MLRTILLASTAAVLATFSTTAMVSAHEHRYFQNAYVSDNGMLVVTGNNDEDDEDLASVAEPVIYAPAQSAVMYQTAYVPVNDTIVTPYGYTPYYSNGYYQGYAYSPGYAYNPYYMGAAYGNGDPVSAAVVNTVLGVVANDEHVGSGQMLQSLVGAFLAAQAQQQYQQYPQYPQYQQPSYYPQQAPVYYPQQYVPQYAPPVQYVPVYVPRGDREHGDGEHGRGDHGGGDHGGRD